MMHIRATRDVVDFNAVFFFSSRRRHTRYRRDWSSDVCSSDLIADLVAHFEARGTDGLDAARSEELSFTAAEWQAMSEVEQQQVLMNYRIAYLGETMVNWCPGLGTVLANDEVVDGVSERGGYPVEIGRAHV